ncbi:transmembrane exosortase [bacterium BMS3Bbin06]|nr:transmembrane exosortase [bacterium BMS3Abin08]GBE35851.1 transmembrane exosortase [bacterium BMS3Bbin06]HDO36168.1 hypothetical protein [Nitrospirota bacterium]HDY71881.1 hypothetical protein [Nitrospirota bacterium]
MRRRSKQEKKAGQRRTVDVKRFVITYLLLMGGFFFLIGFKPIQDVIDLNGLYTGVIVFLTSKILYLVNIKTSIEGSIIRLPSIALDVKFGCNGLEAVMIYSVAVIAFPASVRTKLTGIIAGFFVIQAINVIRIAGLAYSGVYYKELFKVIHIYVAQGVMIAVALGMFLIYLNYAEKSGKNLA